MQGSTSDSTCFATPATIRPDASSLPSAGRIGRATECQFFTGGTALFPQTNDQEVIDGFPPQGCPFPLFPDRSRMKEGGQVERGRGDRTSGCRAWSGGAAAVSR
jgi:hypothetical protein